MNLQLQREMANLYGVFGKLFKEDGTLICYTLEHAYFEGKQYEPKLPVGTYECVRGIHKLKKLNPFETFEIKEVPGHTGILFHKGNYNNDSDGCILLGTERGTGCILESANAFETFMTIQEYEDSFTLVVSD